MGRLPIHDIDERDFDAIATGRGGPLLIHSLWNAQFDKRLALAGATARIVAGLPHDDGDDLILLRAAAAANPDAVRVVLTEPFVGAWNARLIRAYDTGREIPRDGLAAIAMAAAYRAGISGELLFRQEWPHLPGLGRVHAGPAAGRLRAQGGRLFAGDVETLPGDARWQTVRRFRAPGPPAVSPAVDDLDPSRDAFHVSPAERLTAEEFSTWQQRFADSWRLLEAHCPGHAAEIAAGLHSVVPLSKPDRDSSRSATLPDAVGVIGFDFPADQADLAITLVHEFQHSKLQAVHDVRRLWRRTDERLFAPWRTDPRPGDGLFQGTYAFLGVAHAWRAFHRAGTFPRAQNEFAQARVYVGDAVGRLAASKALTDDGHRFVDTMRSAIEELHQEPVSPDAESAAHERLRKIRSAWELHNRRPAG